VGPPLNDVLTQYDGESLKAFLTSPARIDANYPPMPNPGLTPAQINAVTNYLLGEDSGSPGGGH
jgi:cytochrome c